MTHIICSFRSHIYLYMKEYSQFSFNDINENYENYIALDKSCFKKRTPMANVIPDNLVIKSEKTKKHLN